MEGVVTAFYFDRIGNLPSWSGPKNQCRVTSKQMVINSIHPLSLSTKLVGFRTRNRGKSTLCPFLNYILQILINFNFSRWCRLAYICLHFPNAKFILIKPYFLFVVVRAAVSGRHLGKFLVRFHPLQTNIFGISFSWSFLRCWSTPISSSFFGGSKLKDWKQYCQIVVGKKFEQISCGPDYPNPSTKLGHKSLV